MTSEPIRVGALVGALLTSLACSAAPVGPVSTLYLEARSNNRLYAVQGTAVTEGPAPIYCNHCDSAIAVNGDIRSYGDGRYDTTLAQAGTAYAASLPAAWIAQLSDGTTDGTHNYSVVHRRDGGDFYSVVAFDRDWATPQALFSLDASRTATGISYDPFDHSLWLHGVTHNDRGFIDTIMHFGLDGTLLAEFDSLGGSALALDYADGTLWTVRGPALFFDQYSRGGQLLQTVSVDGLGGQNGIGAEFDLAALAVPVPGSLALALLVLPAAARRPRTVRR